MKTERAIWNKDEMTIKFSVRLAYDKLIWALKWLNGIMSEIIEGWSHGTENQALEIHWKLSFLCWSDNFNLRVT